MKMQAITSSVIIFLVFGLFCPIFEMRGDA
jgi:hypothetical protein